jgi:hypothetical protein
MPRPKKKLDYPVSRLTVDLPQELHKETSILSIREGKDIRDLVTKWIEAGLRQAGVKLSRKYSE